VNLLNNAFDAILERHANEGGLVSIEANESENGRIHLSVRDNGIGIRPEDQEKIFRPFFTTKPVGKGTGLGLSVCFGIINGMGGTMEMSSALGEGTVFHIQLPAVPQKGEQGGQNKRP
jgi:two-component system NtrC family sensor kinase